MACEAQYSLNLIRYQSAIEAVSHPKCGCSVAAVPVLCPGDTRGRTVLFCYTCCVPMRPAAHNEPSPWCFCIYKRSMVKMQWQEAGQYCTSSSKGTAGRGARHSTNEGCKGACRIWWADYPFGEQSGYLPHSTETHNGKGGGPGQETVALLHLLKEELLLC